MKIPVLFLALLGSSFGQSPCRATQPGLIVMSPDHPRIWYNRSGTKLSQYLEWSRSENQLLLHLAYANVANTSAVWTDQSFIDRIDITFPTVHLDRIRNQLYVVGPRGLKRNLGHLEHGMFGDRVILDAHLEVSAHRQNGVIAAAIETSRSSEN